MVVEALADIFGARRRPRRDLLAGLLLALLAGCGGGTDDAVSAGAADQASARAAAEEGPEPVVPFRGEAAPAVSRGGVVLRVLAEGDVSDEGTLTLPAMEQDMVYLMARVEHEDGSAIAGAAIDVRSEKGNPVMLDEPVTDDYGYAAFTVFAAQPGMDALTLAARGVETRFRLDVMRLDESPWLRGLQGEGVTRWSLLGGAGVRFADDGVQAEFTPAIAALAGEQVRLAGYMMPMTPDMEQQDFLISASPPNCFFHMPGGPTTVVRVQTPQDRGIAMTMDPLTVEGRLQLAEQSPEGILYRLVDARLIR